MQKEPLFEFERQRLFTDVGTLILSRFLRTRPHSLRVENVERDPGYRRRDIDLRWHRAISGREITMVEIKCDAHAGTDDALIQSGDYPYYARRTDNLAIETVSSDATGSPGWIFGSEAEMLLYYFAAIPCTVPEIEGWLAKGEAHLLAHLGITGDRLYVIDLAELRGWFEGVQQDYREVSAQNEGYRTLSRLVPCADVVDAVRHCYVFDDVYRAVVGS